MVRVLLRGGSSWYPPPPSDVDPLIGNATFNISDAYTNGQTVGTVPLENSPTGTPSYAITAGNTNTAFAINSSTRVITVADETELVADNNYSLTVTASPGGDTATITINVADATAWAELQTLTFQEDSGSTASGQRLRFRVGYASGDVPSTHDLEIRKSDGTTAYTRQQVDAIATHDDGSLRAAVVTIEQEDNVAGSGTLTVKVGKTTSSTASNTSAITDQNIKDLAYTAEVVVSSTTYTFTAADQITAGKFRNVNIGPVGRRVRVFGKLSNGGTPNDALFGIMWIELLRDGTTANAYFRLVSHWNESYGSGASAPGTGTISTITLKKNGSPVKQYTLTYNMKGGVCVDIADADFGALWSTNKPTLRPVYDNEQWADACLVPNYVGSAGIITALGSPTVSDYTPLGTGDHDNTNLQTGGSHNYIGPLTFWASAHLIAQTLPWWKRCLEAAHGSNGIAKNYYDSSYGEAIILRDHTYGSITGNDSVQIGVGSNNKIDITAGSAPWDGQDVHHWPMNPYYAWLITGDDWWNESTIIDANIALLGTSQDRTYTHANSDSQIMVIRYDGGCRGHAWGLRNIGNCSWVLADDHPLKQYMVDITTNNIAFLESIGKTANRHSNAHALGIPYSSTGASFIGDWNGIQTEWFHHAYQSIVFWFEVLRGRASASGEWATQIENLCRIGAHLDGCSSRAQAYYMNFSIQASLTGGNAGLAQSWSDVAITTGQNDGTWDDTTRLIPSGGCPASGILWDPNGTSADYAQQWKAAMELADDAGHTRGGTLAGYYRTQFTADPPSDAEWADPTHLMWKIEKRAA